MTYMLRSTNRRYSCSSCYCVRQPSNTTLDRSPMIIYTSTDVLCGRTYVGR